MAQNCLIIEGIVSRTPRITQSPSGISHCQFSVEHQSIQMEADMQRNVYARIKVIASGRYLHERTHNLCQGEAVRVMGFLNRHETRQGESLLVLHAQEIERIN